MPRLSSLPFVSASRSTDFTDRPTIGERRISVLALAFYAARAGVLVVNREPGISDGASVALARFSLLAYGTLCGVLFRHVTTNSRAGRA